MQPLDRIAGGKVAIAESGEVLDGAIHKQQLTLAAERSEIRWGRVVIAE